MISRFVSERKEKSPLTKRNEYGIIIHEKAEFTPDVPLAHFTKTPDGETIIAMGIFDGRGSDKYKKDDSLSLPGILSMSKDKGRTFTKTGVFKEGCGGLLLCTQKGTLILAYSDLGKMSEFDWDNELHDAKNAKLPTYVSRSLDLGKTWQKPKLLHEDWTGANMDILQTRKGRVVFTSMKLFHNPGRHVVLTYGSDDEGKTWTASNIIDLGGVGHHGGAMEAVMVELKDSRLLKLIRTNWGQFWAAYSEDEGRYWHPYGPSGIDASTAPARLVRLASGRIAVLWNRWFPEGEKEVKFWGGDCNFMETKTSNQREELSLSFSEDEGESWSAPVVIAKNPGGGHISYPYAFEPEPGRIWILSAWTKVKKSEEYFDAPLRMQIYEKDFV